MPEITIQMDDSADTGNQAHEIQAAPGPPPGSVAVETLADNVVPMVLFLAVALTFCAKYYFAHRTRQDVQNTVRIALERGEPLTPDLLDRLGQTARPKQTDLRRGVVGVCLGLGIAGFGLVIGDEHATRPMLAIGIVPVLLGVAYLVLWRLSGKKD